MNKKTMLLVLAVIGAAAFMLPASAMAAEEDIPLHLIPKPTSNKTLAAAQRN